MFCPECGFKNDDQALFCENCGTKLEDQPVKEEALGEEEWEQDPEEKKSPQRSMKILLIEAVLCVAALIGLIITYNKLYSGESVAKRYVEAQFEADWNTVYDLMDISADDGEFMTKEAFVTARTTAGEKKSKGAKIREVKKLSGGFKSQTVKVRYRKEGKNDTVKISMERFGLQWKVIGNDYIVDEVSIKVPKGAKVSIDKIKLTSKTEGKDADIYTAGPVFGNTHYAEVSKEGMEDTKKVMELSESAEIEDKEDLPLIEAGYNEETLKKVTDQAVSDFKEIVTAAWKNKRVSELKPITEMYYEQKDKAVSEYKYYQNQTVSDYGFVKYTNMEAAAKTEKYNAENLIKVELSADYYRKREYFDSEGRCTSVLRYIDDNGTWKLYDISLPAVF